MVIVSSTKLNYFGGGIEVELGWIGTGIASEPEPITGWEIDSLSRCWRVPEACA